jgi:hypothetical protein
MVGLRSDHFPHFDVGQDLAHSPLGSLPKINFPQFEGNQPKLWKPKCESYFEMYGTKYIMWVKVVSMHFEGRVSRWL